MKIIKRIIHRLPWIVSIALFIMFVATIHGFLARTAPIDADILVVEAWLRNEPALGEAVGEFRRGDYKYFVLVGNPAAERLERERATNGADMAAIHLKNVIDETKLIELTTPAVKRNRTCTSAMVFRNWMLKKSPETKSVNVFTVDVHARKSQISFQKALGPGVRVGIIAGTQKAFVPWRLWMSPAGIKLVFRNLIGYLYILVWTPNVEIGEI